MYINIMKSRRADTSERGGTCVYNITTQQADRRSEFRTSRFVFYVPERKKRVEEVGQPCNERVKLKLPTGSV